MGQYLSTNVRKAFFVPCVSTRVQRNVFSVYFHIAGTTTLESCLTRVSFQQALPEKIYYDYFNLNNPK